VKTLLIFSREKLTWNCLQNSSVKIAGQRFTKLGRKNEYFWYGSFHSAFVTVSMIKFSEHKLSV